MAKSKKSKGKSKTTLAETGELLSPSATTAVGPSGIAPPEKQPALLRLSLVLFILWFVYLLVVAFGG